MKNRLLSVLTIILAIPIILCLISCGSKEETTTVNNGGESTTTTLNGGGNTTLTNNNNNTTTNNNTTKSNSSNITWNDTFNGVTLPEPATQNGTYTEWTVEDDCVTIRMDGVTYQEYITYCTTLEALSGWVKDDDDIVDNFPSDYNTKSKVYCVGEYGALPRISVQYYSDATCERTEYPHFVMFVFTEW